MDVVTFLRKQIKVSIILETVFSKIERSLIMKHKRFEVDQSVSEETGDDELNETTPWESLSQKTRYHRTLLKNSKTTLSQLKHEQKESSEKHNVSGLE